jgi:hypothetical protein
MSQDSEFANHIINLIKQVNERVVYKTILSASEVFSHSSNPTVVALGAQLFLSSHSAILKRAIIMASMLLHTTHGFVAIPQPLRLMDTRPKTGQLKMGRPVISADQLHKMLNLPADPLTGKMKVVSNLAKDNHLRKLAQKALSQKIDQDRFLKLLNQCRRGDFNPAKGTKSLHGAKSIELRHDSGLRVTALKRGDVIEITGIFHKNTQTEALGILPDKELASLTGKKSQTNKKPLKGKKSENNKKK